VINGLMRATGTVLLAVAAWLIWVRGAAYSLCTGWNVNRARPGCQEAAGAHYWGIVLAMTGGVLLACSFIPPRPLPQDPQQAYEGSRQFDRYRVAPYFADLP
jgi:hypothetical protein